MWVSDERKGEEVSITRERQNVWHLKWSLLVFSVHVICFKHHLTFKNMAQSGTQRNISKERRKRPFVWVATFPNLQSLKKSTCPGHQLLIEAPKFSFFLFQEHLILYNRDQPLFFFFSVISPYWMPSRWPSVSSAVSPAGPDTSPAPPASPLPASGRAPLNGQMLQIHMLEVCCGTAMKTATCCIL